MSYPGVYIEEIPSGARTITGVATSITAFVGWAPRGPVDRAELILSWPDYEQKFGGLDRRSALSYSVNLGMDLERVRCGYLSVPENRAEDDGRVLRIAVAIVEAPEATDDPVVLLPGGPGVAPVFDGYVGLIHRWIPPDRTLIVFDARGTGHSRPLQCPELNATESEMSAKVKASIREELAEESPPHFWEVVDRGRNLHYLTGPERAQLDTFLGWLEEVQA